MSASTYLGDGVYIALNNAGQVELTTETGQEVTNTIYLEPEVVDAFMAWIARTFVSRAMVRE